MKTVALLLAVKMLLAVPLNASAQSISTVQFSSPRYTVNENGGSVMLTVERIGEAGGTAWVDYVTRSGTATNGEDYVEQSGWLQFLGKANLTIVIPILNDAVMESDESFTVTLSNFDPFDTELGAVTNVVVTILDNDRARFSASSFTVDEGVGIAVITVRVGGESTNSVTLDYFTIDKGSAKSDEDFVPQNGTLTFAPGETEKAFEVTILDDGLPEIDEVVGLSLSSADLLCCGPWPSAILRIRDNDGIVEFSAPSYFVDEGASMAVITVRRTDVSTNAFSVGYSASDGCSATPGTDYLPSSGRLTFAVGETEKSLLIPIMDNALPEGDKTVRLVLDQPLGAGLGACSNAVLWIRDNDSPMERGAELTPQRLGFWSASAEPFVFAPADVAVSGDSIYLMGGVPHRVNEQFFFPTTFVALDATDVTHPRLVERHNIDGDIPRRAVGVKVVCDHAFHWGWSFCTVKLGQPTNSLADFCVFGSSPDPAGSAVEGNRAYLASNPWLTQVDGRPGGVAIFDISNPDEPRLIGKLELFTANVAYMDGSMAVVGDYIYLPAWTWDPWLPRYSFSFKIIDVHEPWNPQPVGEIDWLSRDAHFAIVGERAFVTAGTTLVVLDVHDPLHPRQMAELDIGLPVFKPTVAGAYAYVGTAAGLAIIDVRDPAHPRQASFYPTERAVLAVAVSGDRGYLAESDGLEILDLNPLGFRPGSLTRGADDQVGFALNTRPGRSYTVQASTNLVDWESLGTRTAFDTKLTFTDTNAPSCTHRFYRAVSP